METKRECICLAYFVDDLFIGWYGDSFGSVSKYPKIYGNSVSQLSTIKTNFYFKMTRINETSFNKEIAKIPENCENPAEALKLFIFADEKALRGRKVELRVVACPVYDGPNPDFDEIAYNTLRDKRNDDLKALGIYDLPAGSMKRMIIITAYEKEHPMPVRNSWIYATAEDVKVFAETEPTEFLKTIKFNAEPKSTKYVDTLEEETGDSFDTEVEDDSTEEL